MADLIAQPKSQTTAVTGIGILESANDLSNGIKDGSWVEGGLGALGVGLEVLSMVMDPIGTLAQYGASWLIEHVQPLKTALDWLAGNPPVIQSFADTWTNVAKEVNHVATDLATKSASDTAGWTGQAADAYRTHTAQQADAIASAATLADGISTGVMLMGQVVAAVRETVRDLIAELVGKLISWLIEEACSIGFATPLVAAQATTAITTTISKVSTLIRKLIKTISNIAPKLRKIIDKLDEIIQKLAKLGRHADGPHTPGSPGHTTPSSVDAPISRGIDGPTSPSSTTSPSSSTSPSGTTSPSDATSSSSSQSPQAGPTRTDSGSPSTRVDTSPNRPENPKDSDTPVDNRRCTNDPIDVVTGEMVLIQTDVNLAGVLSLVLRRVHVSSYRAGRAFGVSWASTLDQRVEIDDEGIVFVTDDGMLLVYPHPPEAGEALPVTGPQWALSRGGDGYTVRQPNLGRELHFASPIANVGHLTHIVDRNGNSITIERDGIGLPVEVLHSGGYRIAVTRSAERVTGLHLSPPGGGRIALVDFRYGDDGHLVEVVNSSTRATRFDYDDCGRIVQWTDRNGEWYRYHYDDAGRCVANHGAGGFLNGSFSYDREGRVTRFVDALGRTTVYRFDENRNIVAETDPLGHTTSSEWDECGRLRRRTNALGCSNEFTYDGNGNLTSIIRPDGRRSTREYDDRNLPTTVVMPDGATWRYEYDSRGNRVAVSGPVGAVARFTYDDRGHVVAVEDAEGYVRRIETDAAGLPLRITDPTGGIVRYRRDALGRVVEITDPMGGVTTFDWTVEGKVLRRTAPNGDTERWRYDGEGNEVEYRDAVGKVSRTEYTHFDLPSARIAPDGGRTEFEYDADLRLTAVRNPRGGVWRYSYDGAGNIVRETDFDGRVIDYRYDEANQLVERSVNGTQAVRLVRDQLGNVVERHCDGQVATFEVDAAGRLTRARNADADVVFERDELGRVVSESINGNVVISRYDRLDRRIARRTPTGHESTWEYDPNHQPLVLRTSRRSMTFDFDPAGRELARLLDTGVVLTQGWDANHRLTTQTLSAPTGDTARDGARLRRLQHMRYHYRPDGLVHAIDDQLSAPRRFDIDESGRIAGVRGTGPGERYTYDRVGNPLTAEWESGANDAEGVREYSGNLLVSAGRYRYRHDTQGRLVLRQKKRLSHKPDTWHFVWDAEDRLRSVVNPDGTRWTYNYDALGRRIGKQRRANDGSVVESTTFTWDGTRLAEQVTNGTRATAWDHRPGSYRPIAQVERARTASQGWVDDKFYSIITDVVGTVTELVEPDGTLAWLSRQSVWGATSGRPTGHADTPLRFPGHYHDPETGLHYNYFRYYDPETARYCTQDPLRLLGGPNPQAYVSNPLDRFDPLGLTPCIEEVEGVSVTRGENSYSLSHRDSGAGIIADLDENGVLQLMIERPAGTPREISGRGMFDAAMAHFGDRVNAIEGIWRYGDNLGEINRLTGAGTSLENAVPSAWTARQAARHGFTEVTDAYGRGAPGNYTAAGAFFRRP